MLFFAGIAVYALLLAKFPPEKKWEDLISQLPDEVVSLIISRLSAREAARTSILSRQWRHLYEHTPQVRYPCCEMFDMRFVRDHQPEKYPALRLKFLKGLQTFLQHHKGSKIASFDLSCCSTDLFSKSCLYNLFDSLSSFGVEQLKLSNGCGHPDKEYYLPIVSCNLLSRLPSLKHLHLTRFALSPNFAQQCTSLNILQLYHVSLASGVVESVLSNCSSLRSLTMCRCYLPSKLSIHGSNLELEFLIIHRCYFLKEIHLNATKLSTFEYRAGMKSSAIVFDHVPLLQNLSISLCSNPTIPVVLGELPQLKSLSIETSDTFYQTLNMPFVMKTLGNLRELVILSSSLQVDSGLRNISTVLDRCPFLENLRLWSRQSHQTVNKARMERSIVEHHTRLKVVELGIFSGTENEFDYALSILKTAAVLERMCIHYHEFLSWDEGKIKHLCKKLQEEAISKTAKVTMKMLPTSYLSKRSIFSAQNYENQQQIASSNIQPSRHNNEIFDTIGALFTATSQALFRTYIAYICGKSVMLWRLKCARNYGSQLKAIGIVDDNDDDDVKMVDLVDFVKFCLSTTLKAL